MLHMLVPQFCAPCRLRHKFYAKIRWIVSYVKYLPIQGLRAGICALAHSQ
jgi:hypothetical protein